jgi:hypothetical protein
VALFAVASLALQAASAACALPAPLWEDAPTAARASAVVANALLVLLIGLTPPTRPPPVSIHSGRERGLTREVETPSPSPPPPPECDQATPFQLNSILCYARQCSGRLGVLTLLWRLPQRRHRVSAFGKPAQLPTHRLRLTRTHTRSSGASLRSHCARYAGDTRARRDVGVGGLPRRGTPRRLWAGCCSGDFLSTGLCS